MFRCRILNRWELRFLRRPSALGECGILLRDTAFSEGMISGEISCPAYGDGPVYLSHSRRNEQREQISRLGVWFRQTSSGARALGDYEPKHWHSMQRDGRVIAYDWKPAGLQFHVLLIG